LWHGGREGTNLLLDSPVQGIKTQYTKFIIERTTPTALEKKFCKLWNVLTKKRDFLIVSNVELKYLTEMARKGRTRMRRVSRTSNNCRAPFSFPAATH
jgi:hypothetical protein